MMLTRDQVNLNNAIKLLYLVIGFIEDVKYEANDDDRIAKCEKAQLYVNISLDEILSDFRALPPGKE